jgi:hypothetical protein
MLTLMSQDDDISMPTGRTLKYVGCLGSRKTAQHLDDLVHGRPVKMHRGL